MTKDKDFKRLVRARAEQTGEPYSSARRSLVEQPTEAAPQVADLRPVEKPGLGFTVWVPRDWAEFPPQPTNNAYEVARFQYRDEHRHICLVFRHPGAVGLSPHVPADLIRRDREAKGFENFTADEMEIGGWPAVRLDYSTTRFGFGEWFVRDYLLVAHNVVLELGLGSSVPEVDGPTFDEMAARFTAEAPT